MPHLRSSSDTFKNKPKSSPPRAIEGSYLAELVKQERTERAQVQPDDSRPLWEKTAENAPEYWMDVSEVLGNSCGDGPTEDELLDVGPYGDMVLGHMVDADHGRARVVLADHIPEEARAIQEIEMLYATFEGFVDTAVKMDSTDFGYLKKDLMGMSEALIVEAALSTDPQKTLLELIRSLTNAEASERHASLIERQGQLRQVQQELVKETQPRHRQRLTNTIEALQREIYKMRRVINPEAPSAELRQLADDTGEMLEPYIWRPQEEPSVSETRERVVELKGVMGRVNRGGDFSALDELKWYGWNRELKEQEFILMAQEFRARRPHLFETDFLNGKKGMKWDQQLFAIGRQLSKADNPKKKGVKKTAIYRMLKDVYLDPHNQAKTVGVIDSILKSSSAPEKLKEAARAIKDDVKAGELPAPEVVKQRLAEHRKMEREGLRKNEQEMMAARESKTKTPLEIAFDLTRNGTPEKRMEVMVKELGMSHQELLGVQRTFETLRHFGKQFVGMFSEQDFSWFKFLNADPKEMPPLKRGLFGRTKKPSLGGYFSPRKKMIRKLKRDFKKMSKSSRGVVVQSLDRKRANIFDLRA
jgi:hypothetical protein